MKHLDRSKYTPEDALYEIDLAEVILDGMNAKEGMTLWGRIADVKKHYEPEPPAVDDAERWKDWNGERCQICGKPYAYVWRAPDDLWKKVTGQKHGGGLRCVQCFTDEAEKKGLKIIYFECNEGNWLREPKVEMDDVETEKEFVKYMRKSYGYKDTVNDPAILRSHYTRFQDFKAGWKRRGEKDKEEL